MIRCIAAVDNALGMANDQGIPWQGKVPSDVAYFRKMIDGSTILMGYRTYLEFNKPFPNCINVVASSQDQTLKSGFELTNDPRAFLQESKSDIWVIGGPGLFVQTLDLVDELYLTRIDSDFGCTKFFPEFSDKYLLRSSSDPIIENGITLHFEVWKRK